MESLKRPKASLKRRLELPHALTLHAVNQPQLHLRHPLLLLRLGLRASVRAQISANTRRMTHAVRERVA